MFERSGYEESSGGFGGVAGPPFARGWMFLRCGNTTHGSKRAGFQKWKLVFLWICFFRCPKNDFTFSNNSVPGVYQTGKMIQWTQKKGKWLECHNPLFLFGAWDENRTRTGTSPEGF